MPKRKLNIETPDFVKEIYNKMNSDKPYNTHMDIKDKKDRVAAQIIECMSGFTWQEAMDQLDFVKDFLMTRIKMNALNYDKYLEEQKKIMDPQVKPKNNRDAQGNDVAEETLADTTGASK